MSKWCTVATLISEGDLDVPFPLAGDVSISSIPDWLKTEDMMEGLGWNDRQRFNLCRYALIKEYEADSLRDPDPNWKGPTRLSKQDTVLQTLHLAGLALWLANPSSVRCLQVFVLHTDDGNWIRRQFRQIDQILTGKQDSSKEVSRDDLKLAREIHASLVALPNDGTIWVAGRTLYAALTTEYWPMRYLLMWVVLEALYGSTGSGEITFRLSQRLAFFLSPDRKDAQRHFEVAKRGYAKRSQIVHGMRLSNTSPEQGESLMNEAESLVRCSLIRILTTAAHVQKFDSKDRERYLDDLIFA